MKTAHSKQAKKAFTLPELLVIVGVFAVLAVLLLPVGRNVLKSAKGVGCLNNVKNFGWAVLQYAIDNNGLPYWDKNPENAQTEGSTFPYFEEWARPYLGYKTAAQRLRCPLGSAADKKKSGYSYNYGGNASLCNTYPKLKNIPVPHSRVVLVMEMFESARFWSAVQLNMTMWAIPEGAAGAKNGMAEFLPIKNSHPTRPFAQSHGPDNQPGMNAFFLDGHASLVAPTDGNWFKAPICAAPVGSANAKAGVGLFFDRGQFEKMKNGTVYE